MALNATTLSAAMRAAILTHPEIQAIDGAALTKLCDSIASTVVSHITAAGVVNVPALGIVAPPGTGGGPCTGAATGSIT